MPISSTFQVLYLGQLSLIDTVQGDETAENAAGILGSYYDSGNPAYDHTHQLTADRLSEDDNDTYDVDNGGGHDRFRIDGGSPRDFDAVAEYSITLTYLDGTTANITAYVFQDTNGHTYLAPETSNNSDQQALTAKPIESLSLNSVTRNTGDNNGDLHGYREDQNFAGPVDGTSGNDNMGFGYVDAEGHAIDDNSNVIYGNDGNDTIDGAGGNDSIDGGTGDDTIYGGTGADTIDGGIGADSIRAGDEDDLIYGGDGNDTIYYGDGNDTVYGGAGNDLIDDVEFDHLMGEALIYGGDGDDTVWSGAASETIHGDAGNDEIHAEEGDDFLYGGEGVDVLWGEQGNDYISGDGGSDYLIGGEGNDTLDGGTGNDSLYGLTGNDSLIGGDGDDYFYYVPGDGLDTIADFNFGNTGSISDGINTNNDFIDLSSYYDSMNELRADWLDDGILNQSNAADYSNNTQFAGGDGIVFEGATISDFTTDTTGVVCFTDGTMIHTAKGNRPIEELKIGDLVHTVDRGLQPIKWIGASHYTEQDMIENPKLRPIVVNARVFGSDRDLVVSRQHAFLLPEQDRLVRAIQMVKADVAGVRVAKGRKRVTYYHIMFERHELIYAEGIATESMYPGPQALRALCTEAIDDLLSVFPQFTMIGSLAEAELAYGPTARRMLDTADLRAAAA
ncbi:Hint domain-containing protein [Donghicola sp. XS_ASV15]|uniref:Hint domain-containing protein n=1 Tax=Donghicola sp. XS_ASV15 TaxID=3241295 RepID=UPI0035149DAE